MLKRIVTLALTAILVLLPLTSLADNFNTHHPIAYMECKFTCGCSRGGSGAMIGRYGLITAAHNLYCHNHSQPLEYCNFYFGAKSPGSCWYQYSGKFTYRVYDNFANGYNSANDIGYVIFPKPVGEETGWYGWMVGSDYDLNEEFMNMLTYDSTRHLQNIFEVQYVVTDTQVYWDGWIEGAEGGPVYMSGEDLGDYYVVAVYTSHSSDGCGYGRRLTMDIIEDMRSEGAFAD